MSKFNAQAASKAIATGARAIVAAFRAEDTAASKASEARAKAIGSMLNNAAFAGLPRDKAGVTWLMDQFKADMAEAVATGLLEQKTVTEYAQGVARAYAHNVAWTPRLKNDPTMALPWSAKKSHQADGASKSAKAVQKPGKPATVTKATAFEAARALLAQLRALNLDSVAADVLDAMLTVDGFSETEAKASKAKA